MNRQPQLPQKPQGYHKLNAACSFTLNKRSTSQKRNPLTKYRNHHQSTGGPAESQAKIIDTTYHQLPNIVINQDHVASRSRSIKPQTIAYHSGARNNDSQSSISPRLESISRFINMDKCNNMSSMRQNSMSKADLTTKASQPTEHLITEHLQASSEKGGHPRNHGQERIPRSQSEEAILERSKVVSSLQQQSRWQEDFDDLKVRFITDFDQQKLLKRNKLVTSSKSGTKERNIRDQQIRARNLKKQSLELGGKSGRILYKDHSTLTVLQPSSSRLVLGKDRSNLQSQRNFDQMMPNTRHQRKMTIEDHDQDVLLSSLNNSTQIGRMLYSKHERQVGLPSIVKQNLKKQQKQINQAYNSLHQNSTSSLASSRQSTGRVAHSSLIKYTTYGSVDRIKVKTVNLDVEQRTPAQEDKKPYVMPIKRSEVKEQSPDQMATELSELFRVNPECNPFAILSDRSPFRNHLKAVESIHNRQQSIKKLTDDTKSEERVYIEEQVRQGAQTSSTSRLAQTVNLDINLVVNQYGLVQQGTPVIPRKVPQHQRTATTGRKQDVVIDKSSEKNRTSRRKTLEPLKVQNKLIALTKATAGEPNHEHDNDKLLSLSDKMGQQHLQIGQVRRFVDNQIEDELQKETIKQSLLALNNALQNEGVTLSEAIKKHSAELQKMPEQIQVKQSPQKMSVAQTAFQKGLNRFDPSESKGFDFVRLLENSSSLAPLIKFQRRLKERSKHHYQKRFPTERFQVKRSGSIEGMDGDNLDAYQSQRKKNNRRVFQDQDESIAHFIGQIKHLIFLHDQSDKSQSGLKIIEDLDDESDFDLIAEPEMYESDSGESKYSNEDKELKDHLAVGEDALNNAMAKYKNADKIIQLNDLAGKSHLTSHLVTYMQEMNRNGHVPKSFGFVRRNHSIDEIDGSNCQISDAQTKAIALSLDKAKFVNKLILRNVGLTDNQGISILHSMDRTLIKHLDISYNPQLSRRFYEELIANLTDPTCQIERLEIEGNNVNDRLINELVQALIESKKIVYFNVSRNNIGDAGARDLALLIQECPKLRLLFMHYNRVLGFGGTEIAQAISQSKSMQVFDISCNAVCSTGLTKKKEQINQEEKGNQEIDQSKKKQTKPAAAAKPGGGVQFSDGTKPAAKGFSGPIGHGFGQAWSNAFAANKSLLHVDMSHNHMEKNDIEIIAEGLKENQQILGIHFAGNDGDIDTQGFVKPNKPLSVAQGGSIMTRLPMTDQIQVGIVRDSRSLQLGQNSNCWICEGWNEHRFTYEPGQSDDNPYHDEFKPIKLHLDCDNFDGDLMTKQKDTDPAYQVYRMLPPGGHRYFYSNDGQPVVAKDQAKTVKSDKKEKKIYLDMDILEIPKFDNKLKSTNTTPRDSTKSTPKKFLREKEPVAIKEPDPDYYELDLPEVNYIENIVQTRTIYSAEQLEIAMNLSTDTFEPVIGKVENFVDSINCVPRPLPKSLGNQNKVRDAWDFSLSVFASYKIDTTKKLNDCFELDWSRTKVNKIVKNEHDLEYLKIYCHSKYSYFREVYKHAAGSDPMGDVFCIGVNVFSELCSQSVEGFVDGKFLKVADLDLERIKTNANELNSKFNPKNNLVRHNFLEVFLRICDHKYLKMQAAGPEVTTLSEAFQLMFENELEPYFSQFDSQVWRCMTLWQEMVDFTLKISLEPLRAIYKKFIGKNALAGALQFMSFCEFSDCIIGADCQSDNFGVKTIGNLYNLAMMTQVDEIDKDKHINMNFVEFLEAIVRVADKTEIPHCVIDEHEWGIDEVSCDKRKEYAKRGIIQKLEALIMFLISGHLTPQAYQKYVRNLENYKGMGLWANDIDTGNLNLNVKRS